MVNCNQTFYQLSLIQGLVAKDHFLVVNDRANNWIERLGWSSELLKCFILALNSSHFVARYPGCSIGNTRAIDCDGYKMAFDEANLVEDKSNGTLLFIKLAVSNNARTLIVSFHLDGSIG